MTDPLILILMLSACFLAAVLNLATDSALRRGITRFAIVFSVVVGITVYGYGYCWHLGATPAALFRALLTLCRMFGGINDFSSIQDAPLLSNPWVQAIFWAGHFMAFYVTASAAVTTVGDRLLRRIRATLLRKGPLLLIYGVNEGSVSFGRRMAHDKHRAVLFVDEEGNASLEGAIKSFGGLVENGRDALCPNRRFLRQINLKGGSRRLEAAALHSDGRKNLDYARALLDALTEKGIRPDQTSLLISGAGEEAAALQSNGKKGFGSVYSFDDYELTARVAFQDHPPCGMISFDRQGRATEDFHAVIVGFGRMGRAALHQLVVNGQFLGSAFRVDVFDPSAQNGFLYDHPLIKHYDIRFHPDSGASESFYAFLREQKDLRLIVLCTGSREENREIADDLRQWFHFSLRPPVILQAARGNYFCTDEKGRETQCASLYDSDALNLNRMDAMAMQLHRLYQASSGQHAGQDWLHTDYFTRQSNRAAADFYPAMLRAAGKTKRQVLDGDWPPDQETLENLAQMEHLRWCAFHYASGYSTMPQAVFEERARAYRKEKESRGTASLRISRDEEKRLHACLIPWEELDALSRRENAVTGGKTDYKQADRNNVLSVQRVMAALEAAEAAP